MTEPKLLTEAEWRTILRQSVNYDVANSIICDLRERGMIAPEPVDPLLVEAAALVQSWCGQEGAEIEDLALAALRRGMELAERPTLTREMVREAHRQVYGEYVGQEASIESLHAALVDRLK